MEKHALAALLVMSQPNLYYLTGFSGSSGALLVGVRGGRSVLLTDGRYRTQARDEVHGADVRMHRAGLLEAVGNLVLDHPGRGRRAGLESTHVSLDTRRRLGRMAPGVSWKPVAGLVEALRAVKDEKEIRAMTVAARLGSQVYADVLPSVKPGVSELDIAAEIEYRMKKRGASGPAFETIVASGPRSAMPHARPTARKLRKNEFVVLDLGAILRHYCCDLTRTVYLGRAPRKIRNWYGAVREAQAAALAAIRPGVPCEAPDLAARSVLRRFGLERGFTHSLGHGLGLEVHEDPRLARGQRRILEAGNVVTVEPGVYVQGVGGVRIEDDALVAERGAKLLTTAPRDHWELDV